MGTLIGMLAVYVIGAGVMVLLGMAVEHGKKERKQ
jgi:hypothetical protein